MRKSSIVILGAALALSTLLAHAGVAPALGGNKMSSSGAKIAPPAKPEEHKDGKAGESNTDNKDPQPKQQ